MRRKKHIDEYTCEQLEDKIIRYGVLILEMPKEFKPFEKQLNKYYDIMEVLAGKCNGCKTYNVEREYCPIQKGKMHKYVESLETYLRFTGLMKILGEIEKRYKQ